MRPAGLSDSVVGMGGGPIDIRAKVSAISMALETPSGRDCIWSGKGG